MKLNLGCGLDIRKDWENYDKHPKNDNVKYIDLNNLPLPFENNSVDYIYLNHVFEHLDINRLELMKEIHRILKPDSILEIRVPRNYNQVVHTIGYFPSSYFNSICNDDNNCRFKIVLQEYETDGSMLGNLFRMFPVVKKLFPYMFNGSITWKLKKIC